MKSTTIERAFGVFVLVCVLFAISLFFATLILPIPDHIRHDLHILEKGLIGIFLGDLFYSFIRTFDKHMLHKRNWLFLFSSIPLISAFDSRKASAAVMQPLDTFISPGDEGISIESSGKENLRQDQRLQLFKPGKHVTLSVFISPSADQEIATGIIEGMSHYLIQKMHVKPHVIREDYIKIHKVEQEAIKRHHVHADHLIALLAERLNYQGMTTIITGNETHFRGELTEFSECLDTAKQSAYILYSTYKMKTGFYGTDDAQKQHYKGFIAGYHSMVKRFESHFKDCQCAEQFCMHSTITKKDLDLHSFMCSMNRRLPFCDVHAPKPSFALFG